MGFIILGVKLKSFFTLFGSLASSFGSLYGVGCLLWKGSGSPVGTIFGAASEPFRCHVMRYFATIFEVC